MQLPAHPVEVRLLLPPANPVVSMTSVSPPSGRGSLGAGAAVALRERGR